LGGQFHEDKDVKCVICKVGETRPGRTAVTLERGTTTLVFKAVPAEVCANCGEAYVAEEVSRQILAASEHAARSGVQVDVREFVGAVT
jgi:YgiT-type zinc finger domain-containing protein